MGQSMGDTFYKEIGGLSKTSESAAWVVYSTVPERIQAAAFHDKSLAEQLHQELCDSEPPVLMGGNEIDVQINEYSRQVAEGLIPYTVILENGELLREDTYDSEIFNITAPSFEVDRPEIFSGTFWATSISEAIEKAQNEWRIKINQ